MDTLFWRRNWANTCMSASYLRNNPKYLRWFTDISYFWSLILLGWCWSYRSTAFMNWKSRVRSRQAEELRFWILLNNFTKLSHENITRSSSLSSSCFLKGSLWGEFISMLRDAQSGLWNDPGHKTPALRPCRLLSDRAGPREGPESHDLGSSAQSWRRPVDHAHQTGRESF